MSGFHVPALFPEMSSFGKKCWKSLFYSKTKKKSAILFLLFLLFASKIFGFKIGETCKTKSWRRDRSNWVRVLNLFQGPHSSVFFWALAFSSTTTAWMRRRTGCEIQGVIVISLMLLSCYCSILAVAVPCLNLKIWTTRYMSQIFDVSEKLTYTTSYMYITKFKDLVV